MIFESGPRVAIPTKDVLSYIFENPRYDPDLPVSIMVVLASVASPLMCVSQVFIDTSDPRRSISCKEARRTIRQLVAGFRATGLRKGDCVSIHSFNDVSSSYLAFGGKFLFPTAVVVAFPSLDSNWRF
jgi:hypothetical protein